MGDLHKQFGQLVAAHRRRRGLTQEALAEKAHLSVDMISKIEVGSTGARFPAIERIASALQVEPAELFSNEIPGGSINRGAFREITSRLTQLAESELNWVRDLLDAALARPTADGLRKSKSPLPMKSKKKRP